MTDIGIAIGLVLAVEGALYALFPGFMKGLAAQALQTPADTLRIAGVVSAGIGVGLVWLVRT